MNEEMLLEVRNVKQYFSTSKRLTIHAADDISFQIKRGEIFGLVGGSGSGRSTVARSVMGPYRLTGGKIWFQGEKISDPKIYRKNRRNIQRSMQVIFQGSAAALNPRMTARNSIAEPLQACGPCPGRELDARINELLYQVGLDENFRGKYPDEISGGQCQRVAIARAISMNPQLLVASEPAASLDVSIQAQILTLFQQLQREYGFAFLLISYDLSVICLLSNTTAVMREGRLLELTETEELFEHPLHPYTKTLLSAVPAAGPTSERSRRVLEFDPICIPESDTLQEVLPGHSISGWGGSPRFPSYTPKN